MEARADSEIIDIGENGRLRVQLALTDRPWSLPADTLVLPASTSKDLGQLGHRFREACGPQWLSVSTAIDEALKDRKQVKVVEPLLVKLPRLETIAPNLANLILVPIWIPDLSRSDVAVGQIMRLANQNKIKRLILPVIPSGAYNESPVEAAQSAFKEVMTTKNGSLGAVIFVTLSDEARQWLLSQAPSDPGKSSSSPPRHSTATVLLAQELAALGLIPSPTLRNIFAAAGSVARQRQSDNGLLTTSLILFAAIWLGSRPGSGPEGAFLTRLAGAVQNRAGSRYDGLFADYFSSSPKFDSGGDEPPISAFSHNTRALLQRAAKIQAPGISHNFIGAQACILALLDLGDANANNNLERIGVDVKALREELQAYSPRAAPADGRRSKKPVRKSRPAPPPELAAESAADFAPTERSDAPGAYFTRLNNDAVYASAVDLLSIKDEVNAFAHLAASRDVPPPLSIGVFGDWGAGKSFFMERMYEKIDSIKDDERYKNSPTFYTDIVQIRFNAWHYIETNLWASLVEFIFSELDRWLRTQKNAEGKRVDALFEQLSTSRQLRLDSYGDLIATRRDLQTAERELGDARQKNEEALRYAATRPLDNPWPVVVRQFLNNADKNQKQELEEAVEQLGLDKLSGNLKGAATELAGLIDDTRVQAVRAKTLSNALVARLGSPSGVAVAVTFVLGAPLILTVGLALLKSALDWQWLGALSSAMLGLVTSASAAIGVAGVWLKKARDGLDTIDQLRSSFDVAVAECAETEQKELAKAQAAADRARQTIADAEKRLAAAKDREVAAKQNFANETARGRLSRFIRGKVEDANYARHLGIIASIRKDFGQLTEIMKVANTDESLSDEIKQANEQYLKKLEELLTLSAKKEGSSVSLLSDNEIEELKALRDAVHGELRGEQKSDLPSFERIILYIDDLDRCPPDKVVEVLQAIHLLLYFPLFVVVVAVDARWVSRSLMVRYKDLLSDEGMAGAGKANASKTGKSSAAAANKFERRPADAQDYLEKLFQLPYWVRRMDAEASENFVDGLAQAFVETGTTAAVPGKPAASGEGRLGVAPLSVPVPAPGPEGLPGATPNPEVVQKPPSAPPPADAPVKPAPPKFISMTLSKEEKKDLADFAPFAGSSPRRAKRYLNLYLLLKTSLGAGPSQGGMNQRINQRAIIVLLAVVTSAGPTDALFEILAAPKRPKGLAALRSLLARRKSGAGVSTRTQGIISKLIKVNEDESVAHDAPMLAALHLYAPTVRRYSF